MERTITIAYHWQALVNWKDEIKPNHAEALEETAMGHIMAHMAHGYTSGELYDNIHMDDNDPEEGVAYKGNWNLLKTEKY